MWWSVSKQSTINSQSTGYELNNFFYRNKPKNLNKQNGSNVTVTLQHIFESSCLIS